MKGKNKLTNCTYNINFNDVTQGFKGLLNRKQKMIGGCAFWGKGGTSYNVLPTSRSQMLILSETATTFTLVQVNEL